MTARRVDLRRIPTDQTDANRLGRDRCRSGVLKWSKSTAYASVRDIAAMGVLVVENFLSRDECAELIATLSGLRDQLDQRNVSDPYWQGRTLFYEQVLQARPKAADIMARFQKAAAKRLRRFYLLRKPLYADTVHLVRWAEGQHMSAHADNVFPNGDPHPQFWRVCASVVYLNDNYDGGDLYFTRHDKLIKPKAGMLVGFSGGFYHEHAVLKVLRGERVTMPAFYTTSPEYADLSVHTELADGRASGHLTTVQPTT